MYIHTRSLSATNKPWFFLHTGFGIKLVKKQKRDDSSPRIQSYNECGTCASGKGSLTWSDTAPPATTRNLPRTGSWLRAPCYQPIFFSHKQSKTIIFIVFIISSMPCLQTKPLFDHQATITTTLRGIGCPRADEIRLTLMWVNKAKVRPHERIVSDVWWYDYLCHKKVLDQLPPARFSPKFRLYSCCCDDQGHL